MSHGEYNPDMDSSRDAQDLQKYLSDESRMTGGAADAVYWPATPAEAGEALAACAADGTPVTVSGAGTGIAGGRVPQGGVVLATDKLARVLDLAVAPDRGGATLRVQAGVTLAAVQDAAAAEGFWYPPDPTENGCFVGGSLATNASGARTFRFGASRPWVRALTVALADGTVLDLRRGAVTASNGGFTIGRPAGPLSVPAPDWTMPHTTKHAAGYYSEPGMDLVDLFIGSEGTLGVIAEAELGLIPAPEALISGILFFTSEAAGLAMVDAARGDRTRGAHGVTPTALEFFDGAALELLRRAKDAPVPREARVGIFFEQPVAGAAQFDDLLEAWASVAEDTGALADSWLAQEPEEQKRFREFRHLVPWTINETIAKRGVRKVSTDTAVPTGHVGEMLRAFRALLEPAGLEHIAFGHVGDDHLHVNVLPQGPDQFPEAKALYGAMVRAAVAMGGTISAEHGLGKLKGQDLGLLYGADVLARMRAIKSALDPAGILGRGTLFPT